jgi:PAS domain S-box-containing protein
MFDWTAAEALGRDVHELIPTDWTQTELAARMRRLSESRSARTERRWYGKAGNLVLAESRVVPLRAADDRITGYLSIMRDISDRRRAELELERTLRQQAAVAEVGLKALGGELLPALMDAATTIVCRTLGVEYTKVDQLLPDSQELLVSAGAGWGDGVVGIHRIPGDRHSSPAGYALALREPVIVEDIARETRFEVPTMLREHGVLSDVTVVIGGRDHPFGTLAALSKQRCAFSEHDVSFVQSVANVLAGAVDRADAEAKFETTAREQALLANLSVRALAGSPLEGLLDDTVSLVADVLAVELSSIAEAEPGGDLTWRAALGWTKAELANGPASRAGTGSLAGYTISVGEPVVSSDVSSDPRFRISAKFAERAPVSGAAVVIPGPGDPYGVLVVAAQSHHAFGSAEVEFMQAVANVIGIAVDRARGDERIEAARQAERSRIARDLHDEALRELADAHALAAMARSSAASDQDARRWDALVSTLQRGTRQLRSAIYDLRLSGDSERPLADLLGELVAIQADLAGGRALQLHGANVLGERSLGEAGLEVLRIITEALTNARRHSGAVSIRVDVSASTEKVLRLEVRDDGGWPDRESAVRTRRGTGIASMFSRAEALGAKLQIKGRSDGGTIISLQLPGGLAERRREPTEQSWRST